jgi:type II secretory pathway component PulK
MRRDGNERGVALLMVLLVVALLTAVIVDFSFNTRLDSKIAANVRDALIAASLARWPSRSSWRTPPGGRHRTRGATTRR